eukprot:jgi/Undpi1/6878/HiC_scaffold_21.g09354.m1
MLGGGGGLTGGEEGDGDGEGGRDVGREKELLTRSVTQWTSLVRSISTPMMGDGVDDWAGAEDPDWKADHQLEWGQLTDVKEIGKGLTCTVYTAKVPGRKSKVIAKVARQRNKCRLEDQAERQLEAEFNVLRQVKHEHVVELLGAGFTDDGRRFLLLEHLPEGTLGTFHALSSRAEMRGPSAYRVLKQGFKRLTKDLSYAMGRVLQVAEALEYLQVEAIPGAVVLHRDIRPDNVGIGRGGVVKIFDFGLSKALSVGFNGKLFCPMVGEAGSLRYAAPEVSMGLPHGGKADVYSWALLAWSVVAVREPFEGIGRSVFYDRVVVGGERPPLDQAWPKGFQELLKDCWKRDPSLRPDIVQMKIKLLPEILRYVTKSARRSQPVATPRDDPAPRHKELAKATSASTLVLWQ